MEEKIRILHICFPPSCFPPPITQSRADRHRCSTAFSANACALRPAAAGGFGPGRGLCLRASHCIRCECWAVCISLLSRSQITANEKVSLGTEQTALPFLPAGKKDLLASCFILLFSLAVDISFLLADSMTAGSPASFPNVVFFFF